MTNRFCAHSLLSLSLTALSLSLSVVRLTLVIVMCCYSYSSRVANCLRKIAFKLLTFYIKLLLSLSIFSSQYAPKVFALSLQQCASVRQCCCCLSALIQQLSLLLLLFTWLHRWRNDWQRVLRYAKLFTFYHHHKHFRCPKMIVMRNTHHLCHVNNLLLLSCVMSH